MTATILYLSHTSRVSGGERSLIDLMGALPEGITPVVATPQGDLADRLAGLGIPIHTITGTDASLRLEVRSTIRALGRMTAMALAVRRIARQVGADLVHANSIRAGLVASLAASIGGPPAVVHVRDRLPPGRAASLTLSMLARCSAALIANSSYTLQSVPAVGRSLRRVVHSPVDLKRFALQTDQLEARARLGLVGKGPVFGVVGQLTPWKGQDDAVRILSILLSSHPQAHLVIVGSAKFVSAETRYDNRAYAEGLGRLVDTLGVRRQVSLMGEREDVPQILSALDLLLLPSWEEPFGRAVAEAMAVGVPVVATSVGGPSEIINHGRDGLLLKPRNPAVWAAEISSLLERPAQLEEMGQRGRERARAELGVDVHAARVVDIYRELLQR